MAGRERRSIGLSGLTESAATCRWAGVVSPPNDQYHPRPEIRLTPDRRVGEPDSKADNGACRDTVDRPLEPQPEEAPRRLDRFPIPVLPAIDRAAQ